MRRRNLKTMGHSENDPRERGAWAPFVGVALAVLTAGSLVVFSLVAQRTSLDGSSARGATALAPSEGSPGAITLPGGSIESADGPDGRATGTALQTPTPSLLDGPQAGLSADAIATSDSPVGVAAPSTGTLATDDAPIARFDGGGGATEFFRAGRGDATTSSAQGKGDGAKAKRADKGKKAKKSDRGKHKKSAGKKDHGRSAGHKKVGHKKGRGRSYRRGAPVPSHNPNRSNRAPAPRPSHSSRPAPAPRPQPAAKPQPKPKSSGHSNTKGKGHSKGHGRD